ncbi:MAG: proline dehydrogenase [Flavobacteriales bacterium]|nr:proline dehydrogenase [Flavobacteriales bacterium]
MSDRPISFSNTEKAFAHKSNAELKKAYWLFTLVSRPWMVSIAKHLTQFALTLHLPIKGLIKKTIFAQFVGGETAKQADDNTDELSAAGIGTILDYSVEGQDDEASFDQGTEEILQTVDIAAAVEMVPFCVFKPTAVGSITLWVKHSAGLEIEHHEKLAWKSCLDRMERIFTRAAEAGTPVLVDAEESWMQDAADQVVEGFMSRFNKEKAIVYNTLQMYRHDRLNYLKRIHQRAQAQGWILGVKIVRGAYMEKERDRAEERGYPSPIQPDKAATDRDFDAALQYCVQHIDSISLVCGTHNEKSSMYLVDLMAEHGISKKDRRIWSAQLYGMSDHISYNLADAGYNVAKYVPYGPVRKVLPYLIRRAEENSSAAGQTGRELSLIQQEIARRKGR